jgi:hypothetical protein
MDFDLDCGGLARTAVTELLGNSGFIPSNEKRTFPISKLPSLQ